MNSIRCLSILVLAVSTAYGALPDAYLNRWRDPVVNERIDRNIELHRKGDATIVVVDSGGRRISGARIVVRQTGHEFLFGANAFMLGQLGSPERERAYEEAFAELFNFATIPFYWAATEPTQGELRYREGLAEIPRRPPPDRFLPWAQKHGITLKGHPLLWHKHNPDWLPKDPEIVKQLFQKRFREIAVRYAELVPFFDVVNESGTAPKTFPLYSEDRAYVPWAFKEAAALFPKSTVLMINEGPRFNGVPAAESWFFAQLEQLLTHGVDIRAIGLQQHYFSRGALDVALERVDPVTWLDSYEDHSMFKLPLYITEVTIPGAGPDGEALQAAVLRDYYRLWFSVPAMAGITYWNLADGTAVEVQNAALGGLLDEAMQPKAAYRALRRLIREEWTTQTDTKSDANGSARFRGFYGQYEVTISHSGATKRFHLDHRRSGDHRHRLQF